MRHARARWILLFVLASACTPALSAGAPCTLASDCPADFVCALGRCRTECATARDCPRGSICLPAASGNACQTELDHACGTAADCEGRLVCASGSCTTECVVSTDCLPGARCVSGACAECASGLDCATGLSCRSGRCVAECSSDSDCTGGTRCLSGRCRSPDGGLSDAGGGVPDDCRHAQWIDVAPGLSSFTLTDLTGWTESETSCAPYPDGFYRFSLPRRSIVTVRAEWPDAAGSPPAAFGWLPATCDASAVTCTLFGCPALFTQSISEPAVLDAGEHVFVVDLDPTYATSVPVTIEVEVIELPDGAVTVPIAGGSRRASYHLDAPVPDVCGGDVGVVLYGHACFIRDAQLSVSLCSGPASTTLGLIHSEGTTCAMPSGSACGAGTADLSDLSLTRTFATVVAIPASEAPADVEIQIDAVFL